MITALDFHHITNQIPNCINIALLQGEKPPKISGFNIKPFYFSKSTFDVGVETYEISGFSIKAFSPEKSVVDCFKYANKIGINIALESLKLCISQKQSHMRDFLKYAKLSRVINKMRPYLESLYG